MNYLVDTNVFSETIRPNPNPAVVRWLREHESNLYISSITIGEIRRGLQRLPIGPRREKYQHWLRMVCDRMDGRILTFNVSIAHVWGQLNAEMDAMGFVLPSLDSQLAATALRHGLVMVTRNARDFRYAGVTVLNPFELEA